MEELRQEIAARANELERLGYGPLVHSGPIPPEVIERQRRMSTVVKELEDEVDRAAALGGSLADLDRGLVEFLSSHAGEEVFLSWRLGDPEVAYYRRPDELARRPL